MIDKNGNAMLGHIYHNNNNVAVQRNQNDVGRLSNGDPCEDCIYYTSDHQCDADINGCADYGYIWIKYEPVKKNDNR